MLKSIGTGPFALAGRNIVRFIRGASGLSPIRPTTCFRIAAPSRALLLTSVTSQVTLGAFTGMRP